MKTIDQIISFDAIAGGLYIATFDGYYDGAPDSPTRYQYGLDKTKKGAFEELMERTDELNAPDELIEIWEDWLRDDHGSLHQDDDRDELWAKFEQELAGRFA